MDSWNVRSMVLSLLSDICVPCRHRSDGFSPTALGIDDQHLVTLPFLRNITLSVSHHDTIRKLSTVYQNLKQDFVWWSDALPDAKPLYDLETSSVVVEILPPYF